MTAQEAGILSWQDLDVLAFAAVLGRILLSHDKQMMPDHLATFLMSGRRSPGVILVPQTVPIGPAIAGLLRHAPTDLLASGSPPERARRAGPKGETK